MSDDDLLTTAEAAALARVGASSVKRWADQDLLACERTAGGHRRFRRSTLERFLDGLKSGAPLVGRRWADSFLYADTHEIAGEISAARGRSGAFHHVARELAEGLVELGRRWADGKISVLDEHAASDRLIRALQRVSDSLPSDRSLPLAVLAAAEGEDHTLGLLLAELVLREAGWRISWAGRATPLQELVRLVERGAVAMVVLAASEHSTSRDQLRVHAEALATVCREHGVTLVLGGGGAWPDPPPYGTVLRDFEALYEHARERAGR